MNDTMTRFRKWTSLLAEIVVIIGAILAMLSGAAVLLGDWLEDKAVMFVQRVHRENPQIEVVRTRIEAHTRTRMSVRNGGLPWSAPRVPNDHRRHRLDVDCSEGYEPVDAWTEITDSHPNSDVMYTVNASVGERKRVC